MWGRKEEAMGRGGWAAEDGVGVGEGAWSHFGHSHFTPPSFGL